MWLAYDENRKSAPEDQVNVVLYEMIAKDVGIRGGDIFTITYPIVATVILKNSSVCSHVSYISNILNHFPC